MSDHENGGERDRANSDFIEESEFPIDIGGRLNRDLVNDVPEEHDDAYVQVLVAAEAMDLLAHAIAILDDRGGELIDEIEDPEAYKQSLSEARACAEAILEEADSNPTLKGDLAGLDLDLLIEARGTLVHFARHLGITIDLPKPGSSENDALDGQFEGMMRGLSIGVERGGGDGYNSIAKITFLTHDIITALTCKAKGREWPSEESIDLDRHQEYIERVDDLAERGVDPRYVEELTKAMEVGREVLSRTDSNPSVVQDISELDDDLLATARGSIQPVGRHLGVGISLPQPREEGP
jgi:hypothetical protein